VIELKLLETALLLGALIWFAGCYGILYGIGMLAARRAMRLAGLACYGLQCAIALLVVGLSPLTSPWKLVVVVGTLGFLVIPPVTWRFVERTHETHA
jgi:hypothetical protein